MTMPNPGGVPGAPADPAPNTPPAPGAPAPAPNTAPTGQDPHAPNNIESLPEWAQSHIKELRQQAGNYRQRGSAAEQSATQAQQRLDDVLKALGLNPDGTKATDPAAMAAELNQRLSQAQDAAWGAALKLEVFQRAGTLGADAAALLDSRTFVDSLDELMDLDPNGTEFQTALDAKIAAAVQANANLRAQPATPATSGGDFSAGPGANQAITEAQLAAMTPREIEAAYKAGKLKHLM